MADQTQTSEDTLQNHVERLQHRAKNVLYYFRNNPTLKREMEENAYLAADVRFLSAAIYND